MLLGRARFRAHAPEGFHGEEVVAVRGGENRLNQGARYLYSFPSADGAFPRVGRERSHDVTLGTRKSYLSPPLARDISPQI